MDNKIRKIWYLIIIILVIISAFFYVFRTKLHKHTDATKTVKLQNEITHEKNIETQAFEEETPATKGPEVQKNTQKRITKKIIKSNIQKELPFKKSEETVQTLKDKGVLVKTIAEEMQAEKEGISEVVEVRYMYKNDAQNNVYYRGVWYNIKTKVPAEQENTTETTESKE